MQMTKEELQKILDLHAAWLENSDKGSRPDLSGADLSGADLRWANLRGADLSGADLSRANLRGADLRWANLRGADLHWANLHWANLHGADLSRANLRGADLHWADLSGSDLSGADLQEAKGADLALAQCSILPADGPIWGWKKCQYGVLVKIVVGNTAKRSHGAGRKCRAEHIQVLEVIGAEVGVSQYDEKVEYRKGQRVSCDKWNPDRWQECGGGIHFFLTREEAEAY